MWRLLQLCCSCWWISSIILPAFALLWADCHPGKFRAPLTSTCNVLQFDTGSAPLLCHTVTKQIHRVKSIAMTEHSARHCLEISRAYKTRARSHRRANRKLSKMQNTGGDCLRLQLGDLFEPTHLPLKAERHRTSTLLSRCLISVSPTLPSFRQQIKQG